MSATDAQQCLQCLADQDLQCMQCLQADTVPLDLQPAVQTVCSLTFATSYCSARMMLFLLVSTSSNFLFTCSKQRV
jgi:hypothetical protein